MFSVQAVVCCAFRILDLKEPLIVRLKDCIVNASEGCVKVDRAFSDDFAVQDYSVKSSVLYHSAGSTI